MQPVTPSATDQSCYVKIIDSSDGTPEEGVTSATAGLALWYKKGATGAETGLTESDLANDEAAHSDGGMAHINDGYYRVDLPDAAVPTSEHEVTLIGGTATDMIVLGSALVGRITAASALATYDPPTRAELTSDVAGLNDLDAAGVRTAVGLAAANLDTQLAALPTDADVNAQCDTAISDAGLSTFDHTNAAHLALFATTDTGETAAASGSVAALAQGEASELTTSSIADAVWDEVASGHTTAGTFGKFLGYLDGTFTTLLAAIWGYATRGLTQGAASVAAAVSGANVTVYRGTRWEVALTGLTDFSDYAKVYLVVKEDADDADSESLLYVQESTTGTGDGLVYWNGAAYATAAHASITVDSATALTMYVEVGATVSAVPRSDLWYGVKWIDTDGHAHLASIGGIFAIERDIPKATT